MVLISLLSVLNLMYFYISTFRSMCAVPNMAVFCSSLISWFPGMLLTYYYYYYYYLRLWFSSSEGYWFVVGGLRWWIGWYLTVTTVTQISPVNSAILHFNYFLHYTCHTCWNCRIFSVGFCLIPCIIYCKWILSPLIIQTLNSLVCCDTFL